jgi:AcrR family transcriptional regulator
MTSTPTRASARERLLNAANELFYEEGVHTVGIDRVIERAGVAKATLYSTFGSKDELIRAYLHGRHEYRREAMRRGLAAYATPRERLLGVYDVLGASFVEREYHGCAFVNASAEANPGSPILEVTDEYRTWVRGLFAELAREAGLADADRLAGQLVMLYDGAGIAARIDRNTGAAAEARAVAEVLVDAAARA